MNIARPAVRYYGSKFRIASWIIGHFPPHVTYVEPFGGGAAVLLQKPPARFDVYNDIDGNVVNFFDQLRDNTDALVQAIQWTPYARAELQRAYEAQPVDNLERARRFYVALQQGWGGRKWRPSWRYQHTDNRGKSVIDDWNQVDHLYAIARRLKQIFIECDDAARVLARYDQPHTLFYLDPPYLPDTRSNDNHGYAYEMTPDQHEALLRQIRTLRGMVIISGYPSNMYAGYLHDWTCVETAARTTNAATVKTETLWISPAARQAALPLFQQHDAHE